MPEIHTSELTADCLRQVQLRIEGKEQGQAETALIRGQAAHKALEALCLAHPYLDGDYHGLADAGFDAALAGFRDEGRTPTASPIANREAIVAEIAEVVEKYDERVMPLVEQVVGVEVPVRLTIDVDDEPVEFASHIDALKIMADPMTGERVLSVVDWKWRQVAPTSPYLARNLQFGMYHFGTRHGGAMDHAGHPIELPDLPVHAFWCHLLGLMPYKRAQGEYKKGDDRPLDRVLFRATCNDDVKLLAEFRLRVRMIRAGHWPMSPSPQGCWTCLSKYACAGWSAYSNERVSDDEE